MGKFARLLLCLVPLSAPASAQSIMDKTARDETIAIPSEDAEMRAAVTKARSGLQAFLALAQAPRADTRDFAVKVGAAGEFFWLNPFERHGNEFIGRVANTPRKIANLKYGDRLRFDREDIIDWKYSEGSVMKGNYTGCVLLRRETPEQQDLFRKKYGLDCRSM